MECDFKVHRKSLYLLISPCFGPEVSPGVNIMTAHIDMKIMDREHKKCILIKVSKVRKSLLVFIVLYIERYKENDLNLYLQQFLKKLLSS